MHSPSDEHMMNEVRRQLEGYRPAYNPDSWKKMSGMLDAQQPGQRRIAGIYLLGLISGVVITLLLSGIWFYFSANHEECQVCQAAATKQISEPQPTYEQLQAAQPFRAGTPSTNHSKTQHTYNQHQQITPSNPSIPSLTFEINRIHSEATSLDSQSNKALVHLSSRTFNADSIKPDALHAATQSETTNKKISPAKKRKKKAKVKLNLNLDDELLGQFVGPNRLKGYYGPELMWSDHHDQGQLVQGFGLMAEGAVTKRLEIAIGGAYKKYSWNQQDEYHSEKLTFTIDPVSGINDSSMVSQVDSIRTSTGNWEYLEFPVELKYKLLDRRRSTLYLNSSISALYFIEQKYHSQLEIPGSSQVITAPAIRAKKWVIPARLKLGIEYHWHINKRFSLYAEPSIHWSLKALDEQQIKPTSLGLNMGVIFWFQKDRYLKK